MTTIMISKTASSLSKQIRARAFTFGLAAALCLFAGASMSCSTTAGFGNDVETLGNNIERAAS